MTDDSIDRRVQELADGDSNDAEIDGLVEIIRELQAERETGYNGWKNYPTWCVNLWLSNEESLYREALERTERSVAVADAQAPEYLSGEQARRVAVADMLKGWVRDELAPDLGASFGADLLGFALDQVDWFEVADAWLEQVAEVA